MISDSLALLSQNVSTAYDLTSKTYKYSSTPQRKVLKFQFQAKIQQSHDNLFNFINDTVI